MKLINVKEKIQMKNKIGKKIYFKSLKILS